MGGEVSLSSGVHAVLAVSRQGRQDRDRMGVVVDGAGGFGQEQTGFGGVGFPLAVRKAWSVCSCLYASPWIMVHTRWFWWNRQNRWQQRLAAQKFSTPWSVNLLQQPTCTPPTTYLHSTCLPSSLDNHHHLPSPLPSVPASRLALPPAMVLFGLFVFVCVCGVWLPGLVPHHHPHYPHTHLPQWIVVNICLHLSWPLPCSHNGVMA